MSSLLIDRKIVFNEAGDYTEEYLDGRLHMVVNGVGIAEGVWHGNEGGVFYEASELRNSDPSWDHKPAVLKHPKDLNGVPVSAASATVLNNSRVGLLLNTVTGDDGKQRYKVWIDVDKANSVDARIVQNLKSKTKIEVSTGMMAELVKKKGVWNGKKYEYVAKNIKPDHLAILLDEPGAFSVADGGGLLANSSTLPDEAKNFLLPGIRSWLMNTGVLTVNGSLEETRYKLARLLASTYGEAGKEWRGYVEATFDDKVVFSKDYRSGYFLVGYKATADGVELVGEAVQVTSVQGYRSPDGSTLMVNSSGVPNPEPEDQMSKHKGHIDQLIANGQFPEDKRAWLDGLGDGVTNIAAVAKPAAPPMIQNNAPVTTPTTPANTGGLDVNGFLNQLAKVNPDMAYVLNNGVQQVEQTRAMLVNAIVASPGNTFSPEWLKAQPIPMLEGMVKLLPQTAPQQVPVQNAGQGPNMFLLQGVQNSAGQYKPEEPLVAPDMDDVPAKK